MPLDEQGRLIGFPGDADWDDADDVSTDFGEKFHVGPDASKGDLPVYLGQFQGVKSVEMEETGEMAPAAEFLSADGNKEYCWLTYALKESVDTGAIEPGDFVRIKFIGYAKTKRGLNDVTRYEIKRIRQKETASK